MISGFKHRLPELADPVLNRVIVSAAALLAVSVLAFVAYYYFDQQSSTPAGQKFLQAQLRQYEQIVRDDPNDFTSRVALADVYFSLGRHDDAIAQYEAALVVNEGSALALVGLGRATLETGDLAAASESFQNVLDRSQEADISGELVQSAHYYLGRIALDQQQPDEAIAHLKEATSFERTDSDAWYLMGTAYIQSGKLDEAVDALEQAVLFVPNFREAYEQLAMVHEQRGASDEALYARGMMAYSAGQLEQAAEQLQAAIIASPTSAKAYAGLGLVRETQGQPDEAAVAYRQALHLEPDNFNARVGLARLSGAEPASPPGAELPADHPQSPAEESTQQGSTP